MNIHSRWSSHKSSNDYTKLAYSIRIYGFYNHSFEVIEECEKNVLANRERFWQEHFEVMNPKIGLNGNYSLSKDKQGKMFTEHRYWRNYNAIGYEYIDYELNHENINYLVEGVIEIMKDSKFFFLNEVKINGTNISNWMHKSKKQELNEVITNKLNNI